MQLTFLNYNTNTIPRDIVFFEKSLCNLEAKDITIEVNSVLNSNLNCKINGVIKNSINQVWHDHGVLIHGFLDFDLPKVDAVCKYSGNKGVSVFRNPAFSWNILEHSNWRMDLHCLPPFYPEAARMVTIHIRDKNALNPETLLPNDVPWIEYFRPGYLLPNIRSYKINLKNGNPKRRGDGRYRLILSHVTDPESDFSLLLDFADGTRRIFGRGEIDLQVSPPSYISDKEIRGALYMEPATEDAYVPTKKLRDFFNLCAGVRDEIALAQTSDQTGYRPDLMLRSTLATLADMVTVFEAHPIVRIFKARLQSDPLFISISKPDHVGLRQGFHAKTPQLLTHLVKFDISFGQISQDRACLAPFVREYLVDYMDTLLPFWIKGVEVGYDL
jgi:hypothetical protein